MLWVQQIFLRNERLFSPKWLIHVCLYHYLTITIKFHFLHFSSSKVSHILLHDQKKLNIFTATSRSILSYTCCTTFTYSGRDSWITRDKGSWLGFKQGRCGHTANLPNRWATRTHEVDATQSVFILLGVLGAPPVLWCSSDAPSTQRAGAKLLEDNAGAVVAQTPVAARQSDSGLFSHAHHTVLYTACTCDQNTGITITR